MQKAACKMLVKLTPDLLAVTVRENSQHSFVSPRNPPKIRPRCLYSLTNELCLSGNEKLIWEKQLASLAKRQSSKIQKMRQNFCIFVAVHCCVNFTNILRANFQFCQKITNITLSREEKLHKTLLFKKAVHKMLVKLTQESYKTRQKNDLYVS